MIFHIWSQALPLFSLEVFCKHLYLLLLCSVFRQNNHYGIGWKHFFWRFSEVFWCPSIVSTSVNCVPIVKFGDEVQLKDMALETKKCINKHSLLAQWHHVNWNYRKIQSLFYFILIRNLLLKHLLLSKMF